MTELCVEVNCPIMLLILILISIYKCKSVRLINLILRLHYVPGGHGSHVSDNRDQNGISVRQRRGTG